MKTISGKRMCQILESKEWTLARITGSHHIYIKEGQNLRITIPVHRNQDLKQGLQRAIMRLVGIGDSEL
jgi:predicted RNA binding protein YcfA (HicA-like mRNA interferase family)